ncbi:hypothetical protein F5X99DRAFT_386183 [Biscogniauxia marginata]|nr:hypothetical protein F5X99DRAFT_386183 [Biscogniauxia marginata]
MAAFVDLSKNYSFFSIPAAFFISVIPGAYSSYLAGENNDFAYPRQLQERVKSDDTMDKAIKNRILRSQAAAANAVETMPLYVGSVLAANIAGVPARTINVLAAAYLASRIAYTITYVWLQENRKLVPVRTLVWNVGVACWMTLFIKSGNKMLQATS